jgi:hypothetical protein
MMLKEAVYYITIICTYRRHVDSCIKDALTCSVKIENEKMVIGILTNFHNNKKIMTLTDTNELVEHAIYSAAVEENSAILQTILKWYQVSWFF